MTIRYGHLQRYAKRKKRDEVETVEPRGGELVGARGKLWNLRTGEAAKGFVKGFYASPDGRVCDQDEQDLVAVHPDGRRVRLAFPASPRALKSGSVFWVGRFLVARDQYDAPWIVMDAETGVPVGRVQGQRTDPATGAFTPSVFDPHDEESLVLCDGVSLQRLRARDAATSELLAAPAGTWFVGTAGGRNGRFLTIERPDAARIAFDTTQDALALRSAEGVEVARYRGATPPFQVNRMGESFLVTDNAGFVVLDDDLHEVARIAFIDDDTFARTIVLPSGREWLAIGGFSEWDHYGDVELAVKKQSKR
ncbi:MAG: hypothetical protein ABI678_20205 [Kofleriaceae bacterium]